MLRIGICDDSPEIVAQMRDELLKISEARNIKLDIHGFYDGTKLVSYYESGRSFDLLFLDIEMPDLCGIKAANTIRKLDPHVLIIFCSSHEGYFIELFEVEPFRFLKKPLDVSKFREVCEQAYLKILRRGTHFRYTFNKETVRVPVMDIIYFESRKRKIIIHTLKGEHEFNGQLSQVEEQLEADSVSFLRIHQSYLVNFQQIKSLTYTHAYLQNGEQLPIGLKRQKEIRAKYLNLLDQ